MTAELRRLFGSFPTGVTAVAALVDGVPVGIAASSFTSVSLDPPLVSVCVAHTSTTWPGLRTAPALGISVLAAGHEDVARQLSLRQGDRFAEIGWSADDSGAVVIDEASAWLRCAIVDELAAGDHVIVVLRVDAFAAEPDIAPLVFHASRFRSLEQGVRS